MSIHTPGGPISRRSDPVENSSLNTLRFPATRNPQVGSASTLIDRYLSPQAMFNFLRDLTRPRALYSLFADNSGNRDEPSAVPSMAGLIATGAGLGALGMAARRNSPDIASLLQAAENGRVEARNAINSLSDILYETDTARAARAMRALASIVENPRISDPFSKTEALQIISDYLRSESAPPPEIREVIWDLRIPYLSFFSGTSEWYEGIRNFLQANNRQLYHDLRELDFHTLPGFNEALGNRVLTEGALYEIARLLGRADLAEEILQANQLESTLNCLLALYPDEDLYQNKYKEPRKVAERQAREVVREWHSLDSLQREAWMQDDARRGYDTHESEIPTTFVANYLALNDMEFYPLNFPTQVRTAAESLEAYIDREFEGFRDLPREVREDALNRVRRVWDPALVSSADRESLLSGLLRSGTEFRFIGEERIPEPLVRDVVGATFHVHMPSDRQPHEDRDREAGAPRRRGPVASRR